VISTESFLSPLGAHIDKEMFVDIQDFSGARIDMQSVQDEEWLLRMWNSVGHSQPQS